MKKLIILVFLLCVTGISASAADITVQGEDFSVESANEKVMILPEDSDNPVMVMSQWKKPGAEYYVEYEFDVPDAGGYELTAAVSEIDSPYTSNFYYSVNGGERVYSGDVFKKISKPAVNYGSGSIYLYTLGIAELKKGSNTIRFTVNEPRASSTNWVIFMMDYFTLTKKNFEISSVVPSKDSSVFESGDNVSFEVKFTDYPGINKTYAVAVEDYFHNRITGKKFELQKTQISAKIELGALPHGWYRLLIYDDGGKVHGTGFSVTHKSAGRKENTHFAIDFAGFALSSGKTEVKKLCRALKLAGINTVRERYYWSYSDTVRKYQNETIANEGLDVINVFHDAPSSLVTGGHMPNDLFEVYNFQRDYAQKYEGLVDYMEIWNEEDTAFAAETADKYSAFLKAAAIGITDGSGTMGKVHGGFADSPADTKYMDLCMMNDFMEYSDMYNYHAYASGGKSHESTPSLDKTELSANRDILTAYGYDNRRTWVTEGGIAIATDGAELSRRQQARASVINNVQSIANGNDMHFLFVVPQYYESGSEYGIFCKDKSPSAAYTALENLTYYMGQGEYKGIFRDLPQDTFGYLFNNGENDVGVFWTKSGESFVQIASDSAATAVDLMGTEKIAEPTNGIISIPVGEDPVYLVFNGEVKSESFSGFKKLRPTFENADISDSKRIVIQQNFEGRSYVDEKNKGYLMYRNEDNLCTVKIYNFSDKEQTGVINAKVSEGFTVDKAQQAVTIAPMSSAEIEFKVRVSDSADRTQKGFLQLGGIMNGEKITRSTSLIRCRELDGVPLDGSFEKAKYAKNWHTYGSTSSGSVTVTDTGNGNELRFDVNLEGNGWSYPNFDVPDASVLEGSTGMKISVGAESDVSQAILYCFAYMKDGRKYFQGNNNGKTIKAGYTDYYFPWDEMVLQYLPDGVGEKEFDVSDIAHIAIGVNMIGTRTASYLLKNIGWYKSTGEGDVIKWDSVTISGAEDNAVYYRGRAPFVYTHLPENVAAKSVYISGRKTDEYVSDGNDIIINLNNLGIGVYTLLVTAEDDFGYIYRDSVDFIIQ